MVPARVGDLPAPPFFSSTTTNRTLTTTTTTSALRSSFLDFLVFLGHWRPHSLTTASLLAFICLTMALWLSGIRRALSWNPYFSERSSRSLRSLKLPDLFAPLGEGASSEFEINPHCKKVTDASDAWFREQCQLSTASTSSPTSSTSSHEKDNTHCEDGIDLKAGLLAAICFPAVDFGQLRLCADFLNWMLHFEYQLALSDPASASRIVQESLQLAKDPSAAVGEGIGRVLKRYVRYVAFRRTTSV